MPEGKRLVSYKDRQYLPIELVRMFGEAGLRVDDVWGGTAGNWGRRPIDLDEIEVMLAATRV